MISSEPVTVVVRTGRAGRYADWRATPELLRSWHQAGPLQRDRHRRVLPRRRRAPPQRHRRERVAKAICAACPVRQPCAVYALVHRELHGVWGGLSEADRRSRLAHP
jgi:hypothetical protein